MNSTLRFWATLSSGVMCGSLLTLAGGVLAARSGAGDIPAHAGDILPWQGTRLLAEVLQRVRSEYVDAVDEQRLMQNAARGMVESLDGHSTLLDERAYAQLQASTHGSYAGIGVEVAGVAAGLRLVRCLPGSAAERAGLRAGDLLVRIDGTPAGAANLEAALEALRGPAGSTVRLTVQRAAGVAREYVLQRAEVAVVSVAAETLAPGYGYLRISEFTNSTPGEVSAAIGRLRAANPPRLHGLVLDLRSNPGGVLESAGAVADEFLEQGTIVSAEGRTPESRFRLSATPGDLAAGVPMAVLVNGGSASAAEILAAALRQNGRATLLGRRTYGKGTVQTIIPLADGEALKLTTSRYYTPSGASLNGLGLTPDVVFTGTEAPAAAMDANDRAPTLAERDSQVRAALASLRGGHYASRTPARARMGT